MCDRKLHIKPILPLFGLVAARLFLLVIMLLLSWYNVSSQTCDCDYNKIITIDYSGATDLTDYQLRLDVVAETAMSGDYSNIRFVTSDGITIAHWVEVYDATHAIVWVKVPSISAPSTSIYLLYSGASCVVDTWVASDVFIYYDDMETLTGWTSIGTNSVAAGTFGGESVLIKQTNCDPSGGWKSIGASLDNYRLVSRELRHSSTSTASCGSNRYGVENSSFNGYSINRSATSASTASFGYELRTGGAASSSNSSTLSQPINSWVRTELIHQESGNNIAVLYDDLGIETGSVSGAITPNNTGFDRIVVRGGTIYYFDFMAIGQYSTNHPTVSIGTEQQSPLPSVEDVEVCIGSSVILEASGGSSCVKYVWYDAAVAGTTLKTSIDHLDNTYTTPTLFSSTDYWVTTQNASLIESERVQVAVSVVENDTAVYTASDDTTILLGASATISALSETDWSPVSFNGTNAEIEIPDHSNINLSVHNERTVAFWFKADDITPRQVLFEEGGNVNNFSFYIGGGNLYFQASENSSSWGAVAVSIEVDRRYHASFVFDSDASDGEPFKAYLDGNYQGGLTNADATNGMSAHSGNINIGASDGNLLYHDGNSSNSNNFSGDIDEFKLWNRPLDESEIQFEMYNENDGTSSGTDLIVYYNFNDGSTATDIATTDGVSNNGIISGPLGFPNEVSSPATYLWMPGGMTDSVITVSPSQTTEYTFYIEKDGYACETSGTITVIVDDVETDSVTTIGETSARFYGLASSAYSIVEYGFYYDTLEATLSSGNGAIEVKTYDGLAIDLVDLSYFHDVSALINRKAYYLRSYTKDDAGNYAYGDVLRFISEKRDFSLVLDGSGDAVVVDKASTASILNDWGTAGNTFSLEFWIKKGSSIITEQVLCYNDDGTDGYTISLTNGDIVISTPGGSSASSSLKIDDEDWHYVALSYDYDSVVIYVDDAVSSAQLVTINKPTNNQFVVGAEVAGGSLLNEFDGYLDAMRFWRVALTKMQISELLYDNVKEGSVPNTVEGKSSSHIVPALAWGDITASLGFNVKSIGEGIKAYPVGLDYSSQGDYHDFPFFHSDAFLGIDRSIFNVLAIGDAKPSPYLPRVYWRANNVDSGWMNSDNWSAYAYPGEGVVAATYPDVTVSDIANDSIYCLYAVVDSSDNSAIIDLTPPEVQVLIDRDDSIGTYRVDDSASNLSVLKGIYPDIFDALVDSDEGMLIIDEGAVEVSR